MDPSRSGSPGEELNKNFGKLHLEVGERAVNFFGPLLKSKSCADMTLGIADQRAGALSGAKV